MFRPLLSPGKTGKGTKFVPIRGKIIQELYKEHRIRHKTRRTIKQVLLSSFSLSSCVFHPMKKRNRNSPSCHRYMWLLYRTKIRVAAAGQMQETDSVFSGPPPCRHPTSTRATANAPIRYGPRDKRLTNTSKKQNPAGILFM